MNIWWLIIVVLVIVALLGSPGIGPWQTGLGGYGWRGPSLGFVIVIVLLVLLLSGRL